MQDPNKETCRLRTEETPAGVTRCKNLDVRSVKPATPKSDCYEVVRDGFKFGIAIAGIIKLHGMDRERALNTAAILNSILGI